ncbi:hypothetical protein ACLOJK_006713 [Asimina triloba]
MASSAASSSAFGFRKRNRGAADGEMKLDRMMKAACCPFEDDGTAQGLAIGDHHLDRVWIYNSSWESGHDGCAVMLRMDAADQALLVDGRYGSCCERLVGVRLARWDSTHLNLGAATGQGRIAWILAIDVGRRRLGWKMGGAGCWCCPPWRMSSSSSTIAAR